MQRDRDWVRRRFRDAKHFSFKRRMDYLYRSSNNNQHKIIQWHLWRIIHWWIRAVWCPWWERILPPLSPTFFFSLGLIVLFPVLSQVWFIPTHGLPRAWLSLFFVSNLHTSQIAVWIDKRIQSHVSKRYRFACIRCFLCELDVMVHSQRDGIAGNPGPHSWSGRFVIIVIDFATVNKKFTSSWFFCLQR